MESIISQSSWVRFFVAITLKKWSILSLLHPKEGQSNCDMHLPFRYTCLLLDVLAVPYETLSSSAISGTKSLARASSSPWLGFPVYECVISILTSNDHSRTLVKCFASLHHQSPGGGHSRTLPHAVCYEHRLKENSSKRLSFGVLSHPLLTLHFCSNNGHALAAMVLFY